MSKHTNSAVFVGDLIRIIEGESLSLVRGQFEEGAELYGFVYSDSTTERARAFVVNPETKFVARVMAHQWEVILSSGTGESPEVTEWKTELFGKLRDAQNSNKWCRQWREHAPIFGFTEAHHPTKTIAITMFVPTDFRGVVSYEQMVGRVKEYAEANGLSVGNNPTVVD